jgi:hypothetical protein
LTKRTSAAKAAADFSAIYGTAKAVPLNKTFRLKGFAAISADQTID